ncbi:sigma factor-like helix-turn-helix DNA-binding protein [Sphingobium sp. V4]|uniref:sigma factor-like helix-turn-helix DNA-binding protein n=1 Tax=Sphingobium sp. V4 TaxID=3038927 RepID=UPI00255802F5|nr:sigma factor-like helix-turn-helix DNA-binding protein [Sphingobium sp. V4]WIW89581.1 sigma factor-like helix-turn-helix DNA-binding protein [Sphingobium sp. V4]
MSWLTTATLVRAIIQRFRRSPRNSLSRQTIDPVRRSAPPVIAFARAHFGERPDIEIDALETEFDVRPSGLAIRAWLIIDREEVPVDILTAAIHAGRKLGMVPPPARQIFYLATGYGLTVADIGRLLGISRRKTRRYLLQAIASLDTQPRHENARSTA